VRYDGHALLVEQGLEADRQVYGLGCTQDEVGSQNQLLTLVVQHERVLRHTLQVEYLCLDAVAQVVEDHVEFEQMHEVLLEVEQVHPAQETRHQFAEEDAQQSDARTDFETGTRLDEFGLLEEFDQHEEHGFHGVPGGREAAGVLVLVFVDLRVRTQFGLLDIEFYGARADPFEAALLNQFGRSRLV